MLGIGAGWQINEHNAYGFDLPAPKERVDRFAEGIEIINRLFREDRASFEGESFTMRDAPFQPKPVQSPLPILVGTGSPRMMRLTAKWADQWNTWGDPGLVAEQRTKFATACDAVGRDMSTVHTSAQAMVFLTDDDARAAKLRERMTDRRSLVGGPSELADLINQYAELGVDELAIPDFSRRGATAPRRARPAAERLHDEVLHRVPLTAPSGGRCGMQRRRRRPRRRAGTAGARRSSSEARFTALTPPIGRGEPLLARLAETGDAVERARASSACRAARGGTCWRSGGPRRGSAGA